MANLVWFTNNLRITDNIPLFTACKSEKSVLAVYCFDPRHFAKTEFGFPKTGNFRARFLVETVKDLQQNLAKLNIPLIVSTEKPEDCISNLIGKYNITNVFFQKEWTSEEQHVIEGLKEKLSEEVNIHQYYDQFLWHPDDIPFKSFEDIPRVFTDFRKKCEKNASVRDLVEMSKRDNQISIKKQKIPSLEELGLEEPPQESRTAFPFSGGEANGQKRLHEYIWKTKNIATYKQTRNGLVGTEYSSKFSAWLANGSISARQIYWEVKKFEKEVKKNQDTYWMLFELMWRDFFKYVSLKHGNKLFKIGGILEKEYEWNDDYEKTKKWIKGNTKYDFVNANMKEIAQTGWMSNRGRQNVASFFAKELKQDWRIGASYFESQLIDYDVHSNYGNWQYVSGVGNDPRDRKFNIEKQAERYDPDNEYVNLWLNE